MVRLRRRAWHVGFVVEMTAAAGGLNGGEDGRCAVGDVGVGICSSS